MLNNIILLAQAANQEVPAMMKYFPFVLMGIIIFFIFRSQKKQTDKRKNMLSKLKTGDRIVTNGGMKGVISKVKEDSYLVKIADKVDIEIVKNGVGAVIGDTTNE